MAQRWAGPFCKSFHLITHHVPTCANLLRVFVVCFPGHWCGFCAQLIADPEGCVAVGAVAAVVSVLALLVEAPRVGYKYWRWKRKYRRKAGKFGFPSVSCRYMDRTLPP